MDKRKYIAVAVLMLLSCGAAMSQTPSDEQAYLQHFIAITDDTLTPRMAAHLTAAGIVGQEQQTAAAILAQFKAEESSLEESYNNLPSTLNGYNDGTAAFYARQSALVQTTLLKLKAALRPDTMARLDARVQSQKANLRVASTLHSHYAKGVMPASMRTPQGTNMNPNYTYYSAQSAAQNTVSLTTSMLSEAGLCAWNVSAVVNGNVSDNAWHTDCSTAGAFIEIDLGTAHQVSGIGINALSANYAGVYDIQQGDGPTWVTVYSGLNPIKQGWTYASFPTVSHRYWKLVLTNTPGPGSWLTELQLLSPGITVYTTSQVTGTTSCVGSCPSAHHTGKAFNNGVEVDGPAVSPPTYISVTNHQSESLPQGGGNINISFDGQVQCSAVGPIWDSGASNFDLEEAQTFTRVQNGSPPYEYNYTINVSNASCEATGGINPTAPPDYQGPFDNQEAYAYTRDFYALMYRWTGPGTRWYYFITLGSIGESSSGGICTNADAHVGQTW